MKWYRTVTAADPFAFAPGPKVRKAPKVTWPTKGRWSPPMDPEKADVPPPPPNRDVLVREIVQMVTGSDAPTEQIVALRDRLRQEGFWQGLMEKPEAPYMVKSPEEQAKTLVPKPEEQALEPPARGEGVRRVRERFLAEPPPPAPIFPGTGELTEREKRIERLREGRPPEMIPGRRP